MSGLRRWSDGVLEASWLTAVAVTPAFFNVHTGDGAVPFSFEPSKVILVRVLALVMAAAWVVGRFDPEPASGEPARPWWRAPLMLPLAAYVAALLAGALVSLAPAASFWGSAVRLDGVLTLASYLVIFASVAARLRRRESVERLLDVIVVASLPVCLYSLMQAAGIDPIDWRSLYEEGRIASTLGNPTFTGAYLVLVLPLTLAWGIQSWRAPSGRLRPVLCAIALALQGAALVLTRSRGPWLAAAASLFVFGLLFGVASGRRRWVALAFGMAVAFGLFVLVLNVPRGPLERLRSVPSLTRLAHLFDKATPQLSGRGRFLVWKGSLELSRPRPPLVDGDGKPDRFHRLRPVLGYGMETLAFCFYSVYDPEFGRIERRHHLQSEEPLDRPMEQVPMADRNHNEFWDSVVFGGWLGGLAHLAFYGSILWLALRVVGLELGSTRWRFAGWLGLGGLLVGAAISDAFGWPYLGVALPFGLVGAFTIHALLVALRGEGRPQGPTPWLAIGLAAALLGHFIDVQLGLSVATSKLYFWVLAGLLAAAYLEPRALVRDEPLEREEGTAPARGRSPEPLLARWRRELPASAPAGLLSAVLMVTLLFDFVKPSSAGVLGTLIALVGGGRGRGQLLVLGIGLLTVGVLIALERRRGARPLQAWGLALGVSLLFAAIQLQTVTLVRDAKNDLPALEGFARWVLPQYVLVLVGLTLGLAAALASGRRPEGGRGTRMAVVVACLSAALLLAWPLALYKAEAESLFKIGALFERSSRYPIAIALFKRAAEIDRREPRYPLYVGKAAVEASRQALPPVEVHGLVDLAEEAFERARALAPYDVTHVANLARLKVRRSELAIPGQDEAYKAEAEELYARALRLSPRNVVLLDELAVFQLLRRGSLAAAGENLQLSLKLDPSYYFTYTALGQLYVTRGQRGMGDKLENYRTAISYYDRSVGMQNSARTAVSLALLSLEVEDRATSVGRLEKALSLGPAPEAARKVHAQLARLYQELGQPEKAAAHAQAATSG